MIDTSDYSDEFSQEELGAMARDESLPINVRLRAWMYCPSTDWSEAVPLIHELLDTYERGDQT